MALSEFTVFEVRTTGDDTNGGGYVSGGTDYSQQSAAQLSLTDCATSGIGVTTLISSTGGFTAAMVGNLINLSAGTNLTTGCYQITSYTDTNTVTLDRAPDDGVGGVSGATGKVGGAFASPGMAASVKVAGNDVWMQLGTYTLATGTANVSGGTVSDTTGGASAANPSRWEGYSTTRGDKGARPKVLVPASGVTGVTVMATTARYTIFDNIEVDGANKTSIEGFDVSIEYSSIVRCKASNCPGIGFDVNGDHRTNIELCWANGCGTGFSFINGGHLPWGCIASDCTGNGFEGNTGVKFTKCIADSNGGDGFECASGSGGASYIECVAYGNTANGFSDEGSFGHFGNTHVNCIAEANGGYGFDSGTSESHVGLFLNCAAHNNTSGASRGASITDDYPESEGFINNTTGTFFIDAANGDFRLNGTANQGALARAAGVPGLWPSGLFTGYPDVGAVQHQDSGGGGTSSILGAGSMEGGF